MKHFMEMLTYMQGMVKCCVFTLVNTPLVTVWAGKLLSVYVVVPICAQPSQLVPVIAYLVPPVFVSVHQEPQCSCQADTQFQLEYQ